MFTGIIEDVAEVIDVEKVENNLNIKLKTRITNELKIDQSISHNGVCLTVVDIKNNSYTVTAIKETLEKSNLKTLAVGSKVNIERAMKLGERLDGHIVQGHIWQHDPQGIQSIGNPFGHICLPCKQYNGSPPGLQESLLLLSNRHVLPGLFHVPEHQCQGLAIPFLYLPDLFYGLRIKRVTHQVKATGSFHGIHAIPGQPNLQLLQYMFQ